MHPKHHGRRREHELSLLSLPFHPKPPASASGARCPSHGSRPAPAQGPPMMSFPDARLLVGQDAAFQPKKGADTRTPARSHWRVRPRPRACPFDFLFSLHPACGVLERRSAARSRSLPGSVLQRISYAFFCRLGDVCSPSR